jgi:hypothetical protein
VISIVPVCAVKKHHRRRSCTELLPIVHSALFLLDFFDPAGTAAGFAHCTATHGSLQICHDSAAGLASSPFNR